TEPLTPADVVRTNLPPELSYSEYFDVRSVSKSSQKIQLEAGVAHSFVAGPFAVVGTVTISDREPVMPLVAAWSHTAPALSAVINPVAETVATAVFVDAHVNVLPEIVLPRESRATAVACIVLGTTILDEDADTLTLAVVPKREKLASRGLG